MKQQRIFLLPGFGEDAFIFDELRPCLKNYHLISVDYRPILNKFIFPFIDRVKFCKQLISYYNIEASDKIIGHSMGGYFAFQIREIQNNEICMIGAFSNPKKVIDYMPAFPRFSQLMAFSGLLKHEKVNDHLLEKIKDEQIKTIQEKVMTNFKSFTNLQLALMTEMNFASTIESTKPNPLRIHDKKDRIVAAPDEDFIPINGGHFCLNIYPNEVYDAMQTFLEQ
ncbi:MAG: alpha/beta hydrolase [Chitinophagales bacterium]|nr:alpha/beta hydrolase [Chitinophagales bacterium]